jgi:hypothetical protein
VTRARQFTSKPVFRRIVTVRKRDVNRYGRLVPEVILPDGRSLNHELVKVGMAWWYRQYGPGATGSRGEGGEAGIMKRSARRDAVGVAPAAKVLSFLTAKAGGFREPPRYNFVFSRSPPPRATG